MDTTRTPAPHAPEKLLRALAGRYSIEHEIGRGAMGIVYLARDIRLERPVAIKLLPPSISTQPVLRERFLREARTAARLSHPNIVPIHGIEEHEDLICFVMSFVAGETLRERVERLGPLDSDEVVEIIRSVAWALGYAHANGVVHRDIKPENILLERFSGRPLVADFGVAQMVDEDTLTQATELLGTPRYISPEQAGGEPATPRSDLYSLGVTAFYALTGRWPFEADSVQGLLLKHISEPPPPVASLRQDVPPALASAVDRCLDKDPDSRHPSAEALGEDLGNVEPTRIPYALRRLTDEIRGVTTDVVAFGTFSAAFVPTLIEAIGNMSGPATGLLDFRGLDLLISWALVLLPLVAGASRLPPLLKDIRRLGEAGFRVDEIQAAAAEGALTRGSPWQRVLVSLGIGGTFYYVILGEIPGGGILPYVILTAGFASIFWAGRQVGSALAPRVLRAWSGSFGRRMMKLLGWRTDPSPLSPGSDATEVLLGQAAGEAFLELPPAQRDMLGDVPDLISRLESAAAGLRERDAKLSRALVAVGRKPTREEDGQLASAAVDERRSSAIAELEAARDAARKRLERTVAALELLRLDLLRLGAGIVSFEDISFDLSRAREIGAEVDLDVSAHRDVATMLSTGTEEHLDCHPA